jgi:collagen type III alpha
MATDLHPGRPAPAAKKYEAFVEGQLARARTRIRMLDLAAAGFGLFLLTLAYGLIMALCDRRLEFSPLARQIAFAIYLAGALVYVGLVVVRPLLRPINPYYAARRLEETIPEAKNSVVNWLDLHQQAIAPAFRSAISHQAAKDLADADLEQAISARRTAWLGTWAAILCVCMLVLFLLGPRQFLSLMNRAFAPFVEAPIATRTRLLLEQPEGGNITIPIGKAVGFSVWVEGRVPEPSSPEALKLLYRYNPSDPYLTRLLERGESSRQWISSLVASEVHNGFWYKVAGGDAETQEYRVQVRSTPLLTGFDVTYHYRPYLGWPDRITHEQNLQDLRGTDVTLVARTNRVVKDGQLSIDQQEPINAELVADDPQALRFHLRLEKDGNYRIWFRSVDGERNNDPMPYTIRVLQDHPPQIELTKPGEDVQLPANGVLRLEGTASDDFGIAHLDLRMKLENGPALQPKPYRKGQALRRGDGSYPQVLAYRDFVELDKLQREDGRPVGQLRPGAKIEYWLEGTDNCDYPGPNIGQSKHFKVTIQPPDTDKKKEEQARQEARQEQQQHEKKQDQDLQNQKRPAPDRPQDQQARPPDKEQTNKDGAPPSDEDLNKQKDKIEDAIKKNEQQKAGDKGQSKGNPSQESKKEDKANGDQPQQSKGEGASDRPGGQAQNKGKSGGDSQARPNLENGSSKPEGDRDKGSQNGQGPAASQSNGEKGEHQGGQKNAGRQANQGKTKGNKKENEPRANQDKGSNQTGKSPADRRNANEGGQAQDQAKPKSEKGDNRTKSQSAGEKRREHSQAAKEQNPAGDHGNGPKASEGRNNAGNRAAKPNSGSGRDRPEDQAGQPNDKAKQGAETERGQKQKQSEPAGKQQGGEKNDSGKAGEHEQRSQERGSGESRNEKTGSSQGEPKADQQSTTQTHDKAESGQGASKEPNRNNKEKTDKNQSGNGPKAQEEPTGTEKRDAGNRSGAKPEKKENGQNSASQGKQGTEQAQDKDKAKAGSGEGEKARTPQTKPAQPNNSGAGEKSKDDVSALSEALKGRDEKGRAEARKKQEELRDRAKDPAVRQAAREALERAGQDRTDRPGPRQEGTKSGNKGRPEKQAASKSGKPESAQGPGQGGDQEKPAQQQKEEGNGQSNGVKGENRNAHPAESKHDSRTEDGQRSNQAGSPKQPGGSGAAGSRGGTDPSTQRPNATDLPENQASREKNPREPPMAPNLAYRRRAGELQLEDIKKKINKDVLKQLNMTEADFQKFVKAYEAMLKRKQPASVEKDNLIGPQRGNRSLPNQNVRQVDPRQQAKDGNLQRLDPSLAPPELREAYREFSRKISELEQTKGKK